ncbi:hypothetical protein DPX16_11927 [Anabarilius grahami]|uniref:Uncharacterized protein n=1 Tax=Anabarilius grahami TaxID=495550 RepID=A0A3N0YCC5_ANAGA|nr:hypothetical protein DPX16_11927 [Anabarilius grahami]
MALEAETRLRLWWSQVELAEEFERGMALTCSSAADESELLEEDVLSLTSSDPAGSALLVFSQVEQEVSDEGDKVDISEPSWSDCPMYFELLEVVEHATARQLH